MFLGRHCIKAKLSIVQVIHELNGDFEHNIAMREKQTILACRIRIDEVGNDIQKYKQPLIHKLYPNIKKGTIQKFLQFKSTFFD